MKRNDLMKHLFRQGCVFVREGAKHSVFLNPAVQKISTIPRHNKIDDDLAKKICKDLGVKLPIKK